jgi:hypothetical protein
VVCFSILRDRDAPRRHGRLLRGRLAGAEQKTEEARGVKYGRRIQQL